MSALMCGALLMATGCTAILIATTEKDPRSTTDVDTRVTGQAADVSGSSCYVEKKVRTVSVVHVNRKYSDVAGLEAVIFALAWGFNAGGNPPGPTYFNYIDAGFVADGLIALVYAYVRNNEVSTSESWQRTNDTMPCHR